MLFTTIPGETVLYRRLVFVRTTADQAWRRRILVVTNQRIAVLSVAPYVVLAALFLVALLLVPNHWFMTIIVLGIIAWQLKRARSRVVTDVESMLDVGDYHVEGRGRLLKPCLSIRFRDGSQWSIVDAGVHSLGRLDKLVAALDRQAGRSTD
jgi:hypothetical protein